MPLWFGKPGSLIALPDPLPVVSAPLVRPAAEHRTLGGGRTVDFSGPGRRTWRLRWERLTPGEYAAIEAFHLGARGRGPFLLLPADAPWNYLTANQASGTDATGDTTGFTVPGATDDLNPAPDWGVVDGESALMWWADPTGARSLVVDPPPGQRGLPVVAGGPASFTVHLRSLDGPARVTITIGWLNLFGDPVPLPSVSRAIDVAAPWTRADVSTVVPNPAAPADRPSFATVTLTPSPAAVSVALEVDALAFELAPASGLLLPGRGVPRVSFVDLTCDQRWTDSIDAEATLWEVST